MSDGSASAPVRERERERDARGGPGHTVLMAAVLALPAVKIAYTVGGGEAATEVLTGLEPGNWPDVLIGMLLSSPLFTAVLSVLVSRMVFAYFAAKGAVPRARSWAATLRALALASVNPLAVGIVMAVLFGPWWGTATGLTACLLRQGITIEYRTGRRGPGGRRRHPARASRTWGERFAGAEQGAALLLAALVLPVAAFASALDGTSWAPLVDCAVDTGHGGAPDRLIELARKGSGVVGWSLAHHEVVNGTACSVAETRVVHPPWWER
ncbi:hypothetical protein ADK38_21660 [Streptomyces varsoviensis]|uniref:Integral membrane protein n=2 Tax=Streptomyces varsoviensis TaxID=67373 RepID=A0ABR5J406_9ACTN|nr:hypothetical protein ADK38_21660 [Streptomyces varsoviensis]